MATMQDVLDGIERVTGNYRQIKARMDELELKDKQIRFLVWQNEQLKQQIAALKGQV